MRLKLHMDSHLNCYVMGLKKISQNCFGGKLYPSYFGIEGIRLVFYSFFFFFWIGVLFLNTIHEFN
jgi:hypothetical protein